MKKRRNNGIEHIKRRYGYMFVAPWIFGIIVFVIVPLFKSFSYGLSDTNMTANDLEVSFTGLSNYRKLFFESADYTNMLTKSFTSLFTSLPIIVALSMILALILNQNFKGRTLARAVFFLPVIIGSSVVMTQLSGFSMQQGIMETSGITANDASYMNVINFSELLSRLNLPDSINKLFEGWLYNTFNLIWSCGIQILLFVAGLQTIPEQLYEVGRVEGISKWEEFWLITVPMMARVILLVIFYTLVELFVEKSTLVNKAIELLLGQNYSTSSAMLWPYFLIVGFTLAIIIFIYQRLFLRRWE